MTSIGHLKEEVNRIGYYDQVVFVISYPRSGNTFCRYILEHITGMPSYGLYPTKEVTSGDRAQSNKPLVHRNSAILKKGIIRKRHAFSGFNGQTVQEETSSKKIIFITRNPVDLYFRGEQGSKCLIDHANLFKDYLKCTDDKMLIRYEDLVTDTREVVLELADFLNIDDHDLPKVSQFIHDIEMHRSKAFQKAPVSHSRSRGFAGDGIHLEHHSSKEIKSIWEKYLLHLSPAEQEHIKVVYSIS